jgi:hypothetical protein
MKLNLIPFSFIDLISIPLTWKDIDWAYKNRLILEKDIVEIAKKKLTLSSSDEEIELSYFPINEQYLLIELLNFLVLKENDVNDFFSEKWLFISLAWLFQNRNNFDDPLSEVEHIYSEFDYPEEIENFVRYMPTTDNDFLSKEECINRLYKNWINYLNQTSVRFNSIYKI